jgi:murein DD-endopeptidase MepM/ murein hydrolase activator NlpD
MSLRRLSSLMLFPAAVLACDTASRDVALQDSTRIDSAAGSVAYDTGTAHYGMGADSVAAAPDSAGLRVYPARPRRGGLVVALLPGDSAATARCTWKGAPLPCGASPGGVLALAPITADDTAGTYTLTIEAPNARITRQVVVHDYEFGRELILRNDTLHALVRRRSDIARDARSVRQVLSTLTPEQRWSGSWRDPSRAREQTSSYGIERFYARASDTTRSIPLGPRLRAETAFGSDTSRGDLPLPGWRHTGVDIARSQGSGVPAPAAGLVADVGQYTLMGRSVLIDHGLGVFSAFFHLDTVLVRRGDLVRSGQDVARVGRSGLATGPHLHYGVYIHGRDVDPALWHEAAAWLDGRSIAQGRDTSRASSEQGRR